MWAFIYIYLYIAICRQKAKKDFFAVVHDFNRQQKREHGGKFAKCQIRRYKSQSNRHVNTTEKDYPKKKKAHAN